MSESKSPWHLSKPCFSRLVHTSPEGGCLPACSDGKPLMNYLWKSVDFDLEADFSNLLLALECLCEALISPDSTDHWLLSNFVYLFGIYLAFNTVHRRNQYIQLVKVLYCKLSTISKQLPTFLHKILGLNRQPQRRETSVLPLHHHGPTPQPFREAFVNRMSLCSF